MKKKYIYLIILILILVLLVACQPQQTSNTYQATQPIISGGCGV